MLFDGMPSLSHPEEDDDYLYRRTRREGGTVRVYYDYYDDEDEEILEPDDTDDMDGPDPLRLAHEKKPRGCCNSHEAVKRADDQIGSC